MKQILLPAAIAMLAASCSSDTSTVTIHLPEDYTVETLVVSHVTIDNIFNAKQQDDLKVIYDTLQVKNATAKLRLDPSGPARYNIEPPTATRTQPDFYAAPGETLQITITSFDPLEYSATGTPLMEDISTLTSITRPIQQQYLDLVNNNDNVTEAQVKTIMDRYDAAIKKFVADNPRSHAVPFAILDLSGDDFKKAYDSLTPEAKQSILMPYAELYNRQVMQMLHERRQEENRKAEVASGTIPAPQFTLPDINGKKISLSQFRGKWVVLDFWGSWCGWCIKGFPALKEAYAKHSGKIVVVGIGCNEPEADWRAGVKKYRLPWINLYNGDNRQLYTDYKIEGFPTKAIINPQGNLVDLTTGEDPAFFTRLDSLLN